jgi:hypothetical protein
MNNDIDYVAFHEEGHAVAHLLTETPFKYVTIKPDKEKDEHGLRSLGGVVLENPLSNEEWDQYSIMNPNEFGMFFKDDFIKLSGLVAEMMHRGRFNFKSSKGDFRQWVGTSLIQLPEKLSSKYQSFIFEYTFQVLQTKSNWSNITAVAIEFIEKGTLTYYEVNNIIKQKKLLIQ